MPLFYPPAAGAVPPNEWFLTGSADDTGSGSQAALTANTAYFMPVVIRGNVTCTSMRWRVTGSPTGTADLGIYDSGGNLLGHTGNITNVSQVMSANLLVAVAMTPGRYYLALQSSAADLYAQSGQIAQLGTVMSVAATGGLPATTAGMADSGKKPYVLGIVTGGFS